MFELKGKYNIAKIFTDNVEATAQGQIIELCNQEFAKDSKIRIMPDTHAGAGCTIGTTMTIQDKIVPNLVGVDIGCGMHVTKLNNDTINLQKLDKIIRNYVPHGFSVHKEQNNLVKLTGITNLNCIDYVNIERAGLSIGTLGEGNHFIEVNQDENGYYYLVIHSGSRNLGKQIAEYYQSVAINYCENAGIKVPKNLSYLVGDDFANYLHDMNIAQNFATINRISIAHNIIDRMNFDIDEDFTTIHNYIDTDEMVLRKGAISAKKNEKLIIPINMRDGSIIGKGKGNKDWNESAPHGAGRLMSRGEAKRSLSLKDFKNEMKDVYSTSVKQSTLDEAPGAYKPIEEIVDNTEDTIEILDIIKPVYNFKSN